MRIRVLLLLAVLLGSLAGFTASQMVYQEIVSPIATPTEESAGSFLFLFGRRSPVAAHHVGKNHDLVKRPFAEVIARANRSTVRIRVDGRQIALGIVVDSGGYVLTKRSEMTGDLRCFDRGGREYPATLVAEDDDVDLALLKIDASGMEPVEWYDSQLGIGSWVAVPDGKEDVPFSVGVVGAPEREIPQERAILGVILGESEVGPRIDQVLKQSIAEDIGLQPGDVVLEINTLRLERSQQLVDYVSKLRPGDQISLKVLRDEDTSKLTARLGRVSQLMIIDRGMEDEMNRDLSIRRTGFPSVIQHDCILNAAMCGGPLVDIDGRVVGLNIARSERVASFALPARVVEQHLRGLLLSSQTPRLNGGRGPTDSQPAQGRVLNHLCRADGWTLLLATNSELPTPPQV